MRMEYDNSSGCANAGTAITFALSPGNDDDAPEDRAAAAGELGPMPERLSLLMNRAYEGDETNNSCLSSVWCLAFFPSPIESDSRGSAVDDYKRNHVSTMLLADRVDIKFSFNIK